MNEKFNLAASVLLSRRLKNLLRIDENVEVDMGYVSCAEYQLFVDEKLRLGKHYQPDHWANDRFPSGEAKKPIVGVMASYAEEFCEWLTEQYSILGFRYRLPTLTEMEEYPVTKGQVGCWCRDGQKKVIVGIEPTQWQFWEEYLNRCCKHDLKIINALINAFDSNEIFSFVLARNISNITNIFSDNFLIQLSKALFVATSHSLIKHNDGLRIIDFSSALQLNYIIDYSILAKIVKQTINDVLDQKPIHSSLSEATLNNAKYKLQDAKDRLLKAEKQFHKIQNEFSEAERYFQYCKRNYDSFLGQKEIIKKIKNTKKYNFSKGQYEEIDFYNIDSYKIDQEIRDDLGPEFPKVESQLQIAKKQLLQKESHFQDCKSKRDKILYDVKSMDNKLKETQTQYNQFRHNIDYACGKIQEGSYYYLLFFATLCNWLSNQKVSSSQSGVEAKLAHQKSEDLSSDYIAKRNEILGLYAFLVLLNERRAGRIQAWEGIRIVRERV